MPRTRHARPLHAQPADRTPTFLPPQPLADRERRRGLAAWIGRRGLVAVAIVAVVALIVPIVANALGPVAAPLKPLTGAVVGAVSATQPPTPTTPPATATPIPTIDPARVPPRPTDADGPRARADRFAPPIASLTGYQWPIRVGRITLPFKDIPGGTRIRNGKLMHDGVDMASFCGANVGAAHEGIVLAAGRHFDDQIGWVGDLKRYYRVLDARHLWDDLPNVVIIDDGNGYRSIYAHFRDVTVKVGQHVRVGQLIGHEGATGHASGCHVHYGLFSPLETKTFGVRADILSRLKLPKHEIARIDPLLVLPGGDTALRTRSVARAIKAAKAEAAAAR